MARPSKRRGRAATRPAPLVARASWWERLPGSAQHGLCLLVLLAISLGFFAPLHFSGRTLAPGDTVNWRAMAESMIAYEEATGEPALWATNAFAGMPGYLIKYPKAVPQLDTVPRLLRSFLWPTSHFLFLLIGTYLLVVFLTGNKWGGVLSAAAYGLTTYLPIILVAGHNTKFIALCFAPWLVLAFAYVLRKPSLLAGLLFAIAAAVNLRADHVQITYYFTFLLGVWWIVEGVAAVREGRLAAFGRATGWLVLGSVLALLMVAQPYLANLEYKAYSIRGAGLGGGEGALDWSYAMRWSQGVGELVTLLIADAYGGGGGLYWGPKPFTAGPHYVGGVVLLLAVLALWRLPRREVWGLGIGGAFMLLFSLGEHLPLLNRFMFDVFPLFDAFRVPETWLSAVAFVLAVLGGFGLYYVSRPAESPDEAAATTRSVYVAAGAAVGLVLGLVLFKGVLFDFERPGEVQQVIQQVVQQQPELSPDDPRVVQFARQEVAGRQAARAEQFTADGWRTLLFLVLAAGLLILYRRGLVPAWALQMGLVLLVVIDLWGVGRRYLNEDRLARADRIEQQIPTYDFDRFILSRREEAGGPGHFRVLSLEGDPTVTARPSYHYESLGGYHGAKLRLIQDYYDHLFIDPNTGSLGENALDLLNTRYVVARGPIPGMNPVYRSEQTGLVVLENPDALPRAFFVGEVEVIPEDEAVLERLRQADFDPARTAILHEPLAAPVTPIDSTSVTEVELLAYGPREIRWRVQTDAPRLLVVSEIYYPAGWHAALDGEPVPILRADYLLRAVPIPAGEHTLTMRFDPRSHTLGVWISAVSTAVVYGGVVVLLGLGWYRRRQDASIPDPGEPPTQA